ncbi:phage portal protein [Tabrizicola sp. KVB23]|uniref:Phage portal protein n=1 Tax=Fuscibacter oryzae TaxID=2803939 RepID=A0A8J7MX13_9RHOB|nr:phage portal protein [Fuscibacter oryzae]
MAVVTATGPTIERSRRIGMHLARSAMMDSARADRLTAAWPTSPIPADDIVRRNQRPLVARSREQAANNDYGKAFLRMVSQNVVGPDGIRLQAQTRDDNGTLDTAANDALESAWREWGRRENCDVAGKLSWRAIQAQAAVSAARDGEFMIRMIYGADAGPWGFSLQMLDPQRCPVDFDQDRVAGGGFIRHGIEFNIYGRALAYYFTTTQEGEADYHYGGRAYIRVPADEILHGFLPDLVGQKRGLPWMATALWRMHMLGGYERSALVNARASAAKGGFFQWREGEGPEADEDEEIEMEVEPGMYRELPAGVEVVNSHPAYPTGELAPFRKEMLRAIASGLGVSYNGLANDLEGVNYSSIRQGALDEREHWKELQEWLIEALAEPVFMRWLRLSLLSGKIVLAKGGRLKPERLDKYTAVAWQGRRWAWIDPSADVKAAIDGKAAGLSTSSQFIRDSGRDPQDVFRELAADIQMMTAAGLPQWFIEQALGKKPAAPAKPGEPPADTQGNPQ